MDITPPQSRTHLQSVPHGRKKTGFSWERLFGTIHPYDEISWERRDARITKSDGTVVFEQLNIEVPSFWSQTATDIVASKYFRGQLDTPEREQSARQMIDRVAKSIGFWGVKGNYFASADDAERYTEDLTWLLVNQYASFNSPVWFNVGVYDKPQCSACFILSVEDEMKSILEWYRDEGIIFKGGSGSGLNVSKLRSSREPLSKGGFSSGPVSFMKGADGVANTIRSGGTTRRAAKMVVMNVDHPDLKDFINCKKVIEQYSKALEASGIANSLDGDLFSPYTLLPYQNANNSVRVTDEFMQAVEQDGSWEFKAVTTGKTLETVRAREVMQWIAEAAHDSADPGMQYDTTINRWNTAANTGRINASNPCVTGDTLIATQNGLRKIKDLVGTTPMIQTGQGYQRATRVWQTGVRSVYQLTTKAGYSLKVTGDHRISVIGKGDVVADELRAGDVISLKGSGFGTKALSSSMAMMVGYAVGDGCVSHKVTRGNSQFTAVGGYDDMIPLERIASSINASYAGVDGMGRLLAPVHVYTAATGPRVATSRPEVVAMLLTYAVLDQGSQEKRFTEQIFSLEKDSVGAILQGLFTADGTVSGNREKGYYVGLDSTSVVLLEQVQLLLLSFGIKSKLYRNRRTGDLHANLPDANRNKKSYSVQQMHSLRITRSSRILFEHEIGFVGGTPKAEKLQQINAAYPVYRDILQDEFVSLEPIGTEPVYDLTEPITSHFVANGMVVHNCSEYMHLDNSACNLASLNLLKFLRSDGSFDTALFRRAVDTMIMAQEIIVGYSSYPTEKITQNAHDFRELGLGYANLGALLMAMGLPYDGEQGLLMAGQITSLMCGQAYRMSALIADVKGPYAGYVANREPQLSVIDMHRAEADTLFERATAAGVGDRSLQAASRVAWHEALELAREYGVRNSQVTVLAPTGTIAFMMDCATTGIEPELALIKYKKLVGGGVLKLINSQVPAALKNLGYLDEEVKAIGEYLIEHETIEGAPHLKEEHLPVFDCSFKASKGTRSIGYMGHLRMMAAAQPFISGAISKTINMPTAATVEDVYDAFMQGWKMGLKAIAIYRDGSKGVQPLSTSKEKEKQETKTPSTSSGQANLVEKINGYTRIHLPDERPALTHKFSVGGYEGYMTVGLYPETKKPGELFLVAAKEGSTVSGLLDTIATLVSMCLQSGIPLKTLVRKFKDMSFAPAGFTNTADIPVAKSIMDYVFRYLGTRFLKDEEREELFGPGSGPQHDAPIEMVSIAPREPRVADTAHLTATNADAPVCQCGTLMFKAGSCYSCPNCFYTTGVCN